MIFRAALLTEHASALANMTLSRFIPYSNTSTFTRIAACCLALIEYCSHFTAQSHCVIVRCSGVSLMVRMMIVNTSSTAVVPSKIRVTHWHVFRAAFSFACSIFRITGPICELELKLSVECPSSSRSLTLDVSSNKRERGFPPITHARVTCSRYAWVDGDKVSPLYLSSKTIPDLSVVPACAAHSLKAASPDSFSSVASCLDLTLDMCFSVSRCCLIEV